MTLPARPDNPYPKAGAYLMVPCPACREVGRAHPLGRGEYYLECACGWRKAVAAHERQVEGVTQ